MTIRERVIFFFKKLKEEENITAKQFEKITGYSASNISSLSTGVTKSPKAELIKVILNYDNRINPYWLLGFDNQEMHLAGVEKKETELADIINRRKKEGKKLTAEMMTGKERLVIFEELLERMDRMEAIVLKL